MRGATKGVVALALFFLLLLPASGMAGKKDASGPAGPTCRLPESNADGLVILNNFYPGYWWDHTDLTIAVQAHPSATAEQLGAIRSAIATWSGTLYECFDGLITLRDVTGAKRQAADIVVHYVPDGRRIVFGGYAICGDHKCPNIIVRSACRPASIAIPTTRSISGG